MIRLNFAVTPCRYFPTSRVCPIGRLPPIEDDDSSQRLGNAACHIRRFVDALQSRRRGEACIRRCVERHAAFDDPARLRVCGPATLGCLSRHAVPSSRIRGTEQGRAPSTEGVRPCSISARRSGDLPHLREGWPCENRRSPEGRIWRPNRHRHAASRPEQAEEDSRTAWGSGLRTSGMSLIPSRRRKSPRSRRRQGLPARPLEPNRPLGITSISGGCT